MEMMARGLRAGLVPLPEMSISRAGADFLPFMRAGSAVLFRTFLLLGTKTLATAVSARYFKHPSPPKRRVSLIRIVGSLY